MKRFVLTGAPGAGKTAVLRELELDGFGVVEEAAADFIALAQARGVAEPWMHPSLNRGAWRRVLLRSRLRFIDHGDVLAGVGTADFSLRSK